MAISCTPVVKTAKNVVSTKILMFSFYSGTAVQRGRIAQTPQMMGFGLSSGDSMISSGLIPGNPAATSSYLSSYISMLIRAEPYTTSRYGQMQMANAASNMIGIDTICEFAARLLFSDRPSGTAEASLVRTVCVECLTVQYAPPRGTSSGCCRTSRGPDGGRQGGLVHGSHPNISRAS